MKNKLNFDPWGRNGVYVQLSETLANGQVGSQAEHQSPWASCCGICNPSLYPSQYCPSTKLSLGLHFSSADHAHRWLANWNFTYLERKASCLLVSAVPSLQVCSSLAIVLTQSGTLPHVTGSSRVMALQTPGSVIATRFLRHLLP